jgi:hypothetical protein
VRARDLFRDGTLKVRERDYDKQPSLLLGQGLKRRHTGDLGWIVAISRLAGRVWGAGLYFPLEVHDVLVEHVGTNLEFLVCFSFEYPQHAKISSLVLVASLPNLQVKNYR